MAELKGNKYGTHRVIEPKGVLTQAAWKVDNDMSKVYSNEIVCDVTSLNIDSASFTQISDACGGDEKKIGEMILGIVAERGKQQNPVTGSVGTRLTEARTKSNAAPSAMMASSLRKRVSIQRLALGGVMREIPLASVRLKRTSVRAIGVLPKFSSPSS